MAPSNSLRKAAILVTALDARSADQLLDQMPAAHAARVRQAIFELDVIEPEEQRQILAEFLRRTGRSRELPAHETTSDQSHRPDSRSAAGSDVELVLSGESASAHSQVGRDRSAAHAASQEPPPAAPRGSRQVPPFDFLREQPGAELASILRREHPQTIAVVVAHLPPERSAELLEAIPAALRAEVLRRVADLAEADPEAIREIEHELRKSHAAGAQSPGIDRVQSILAAAGAARTARRADLAPRHDPPAESHGDAAELAALAVGQAVDDSWESPWQLDSQRAGAPRDLAGEIEAHRRLARSVAEAAAEESLPAETPPTDAESDDAFRTPSVTVRWSFAELADLNDRDLARVLQHADTDLAMVALAGAEPAFVARLVGQLPPALARQFSHRIENLGPLPLRDIESAQRKIAEIAESLAEQGHITQRPPRPFAVAA